MRETGPSKHRGRAARGKSTGGTLKIIAAIAIILIKSVFRPLAPAKISCGFVGGGRAENRQLIFAKGDGVA